MRACGTHSRCLMGWWVFQHPLKALAVLYGRLTQLSKQEPHQNSSQAMNNTLSVMHSLPCSREGCKEGAQVPETTDIRWHATDCQREGTSRSGR